MAAAKGSSKGGRKGQAKTSVPVDQEDIELKEDLDRTFKPIFEEFGDGEGIPLKVLRDKMREEGVTQQIDPDKVTALLRRADEDEDGRLDYNEFVTLMTEQSALLSPPQLSRFQNFVRGAISTVVPSHSKNKYGVEIVEDYTSHYNCKPPPLFMIIISAIEVGVFIFYAVELNKAGTPVTAKTGCPTYSPLIFNPSRRYEAWRFLTYMFMHIGYMHLITNLIFQLVLGLPLEMVHKWWRIGLVYSLGVVAGSLAHSVVDTYTLLAGASGGCYALIGAHFATIIMNWKEMTHDWMSGPVKFLLSGPIRLLFWSLFAAVDIGSTIYTRYQGGGEGIGYAAHFGGALAGLLIGIPVLKNIDEVFWEKILWWVCLIVYLLIVVFAVLWNVFYPNYPATDWRPCCPIPRW